MSVLIKGMEMPKGKALSLIIYFDGDVTVNLKDTSYKAVEVPTPHGRLIDADSFFDEFPEIDIEPYCNMPTVIESEE